jgi:hypothetical protein
MLPEIFKDISGFVPPDILKTYINAETFLSAMEIDDHLLELKEVGLEEYLTGTDIIRRMESIYLDSYIALLQSYGIKLTQDETPKLSLLLGIATSITLYINGDCVDYIENYTPATDDPLEEFIDLVEAIEGPSRIDLYQHIESVDYRLIERMTDMPITEDIPEDNRWCLQRYKKYKAIPDGGPTETFIRSRGTLPLVFKDSLKALRSEILAMDDVKEAASQIASLALASDYEDGMLVTDALRDITVNIPSDIALLISGRVKNILEGVLDVQ